LLRPDLLADVAAHAPVAAEHTAFIELRLAADAQVAHAARRGAAQHEGLEGQVRFEVGAVGVEGFVVQALGVVGLPGRLADQRGVVERAGRRTVGDIGEAVLRVLLPVPVDRDAQQRMKALLALTRGGQVVRRHARDQQATRDAAHHQQQLAEHAHRLRRVGHGFQATHPVFLLGPGQAQHHRHGEHRHAGPMAHAGRDADDADDQAGETERLPVRALAQADSHH
jgi:hypothetical protein